MFCVFPIARRNVAGEMLWAVLLGRRCFQLNVSVPSSFCRLPRALFAVICPLSMFLHMLLCSVSFLVAAVFFTFELLVMFGTKPIISFTAYFMVN